MLGRRALEAGATAARRQLAVPVRAATAAATQHARVPPAPRAALRPLPAASAAPRLPAAAAAPRLPSSQLQHRHQHHPQQQQQQRRRLATATRAADKAAAADADAGAPPAALLLAGRHHGRLPIVLLAGWLGAAERPYLKYVDLWERRLGASRVLRARPHAAALVVPALGEAAAARDAAALAAASAADPAAPVVLHLFSGGGFLYSALVLRALARRGDLKSIAPRIAAAVLDSSPAYVTSDVSARALVAAALREPADRVAASHPLLLGAVRGAVGAYLALGPMRRRLERTEADWHRLVPPCPKLYLYSESDVLVSPDTIQGHMAAEAVRGARVYAHRWADTPHVEHYRLHPEEYATTVARFADEALDLQEALASADGSGTEAGSSGSLSRASSSGGSSSSGRSVW